MTVPFLDLKAHHTPYLNDFTKAIREVIEAGTFAGGPQVAAFEQEFAKFCGVPFGIGVGSGTEALWLVMLALGIGPGDEVITVPNSFMATAEAITYCGAVPVFVDVDPLTYTMAPEHLEEAITANTKAIIPVHLFGQPADMEPICRIADTHGIPVIADACQAHGAKYKDQKIASFGIATCFSFYPGKNLGAFGEAGAIVTADELLDAKIRILRDHGQIQKYHHDLVGWNCRMDGIQAAVLQFKLQHLEYSNQRRRAHAAYYNRELSDITGVTLPGEAEYAHHVYHVYAIRTPQRSEVMGYLRANGVECGIHYPIPIHLQKAYENLGYNSGAFPVAEQCAQEFISLPMFPELSPEQTQKVVETLKAAKEVLGDPSHVH